MVKKLLPFIGMRLASRVFYIFFRTSYLIPVAAIKYACCIVNFYTCILKLLPLCCFLFATVMQRLVPLLRVHILKNINTPYILPLCGHWWGCWHVHDLVGTVG